MSTSGDRLAEQVAAASSRVAQLRARQLALEMRASARAKVQAQREFRRHQTALLHAIVAAGFGAWSPEQVVKALRGDSASAEASRRQAVGAPSGIEVILEKEGRRAAATPVWAAEI